MTDSHNTFPNNNLYLLWKQRERYVLVQTYNLGGPAVKKSDLKYSLVKSVIIIEQCTWKKLEVDGYIVQKGTVHE